MRRVLALCMLAALVAIPASAREVHGGSDVFSGHGVRLAWAILRGPDESRTFVVVRVVTDPGIRAMSVEGRDPFTAARKTWTERAPTAGSRDVRIPRAGFAEFPHSQWRFFAGGDEPTLAVSYHGVPDTTPEFADESRLAAYLEQRLAR